jgi:hypothetical protein
MSEEPVVDTMGFAQNRPNGARIYDYMLGGKDNFHADRVAAQAMLEASPAAWRTARANRGFLGRAVRLVAGEGGIRQFLDIGTGLPTQQNVHQVAQEAAPGSRVVYVDNDPMVVAHANALLAIAEGVAAIEGDLRRPADILAHPAAQLIDFSRPVGVLLVAVMHFIADEDDPGAIMATLRAAMAPGSYLILSHTIDEDAGGALDTAKSGFQRAGTPLFPRSRARVERFFDGFDLLEPGLVEVHTWRRDEAEEGEEENVDGPSSWVLAGAVGRLSAR